MTVTDNIKFSITIGTMLTMILSVVIGSLTVYNHNEKNTRETREALARESQDMRTLIRDNNEAIKDMISAYTSSQDNISVRLSAIEGDRWSINQESEQAARNAIANPGIRHADPKNPGHFFYVEPTR